MTVDRSSDRRDVSDVMTWRKVRNVRDKRVNRRVTVPQRGGPLNDISWESTRKWEGMRISQRGGKKRGREVKRRERGETVGLVTRCVLLLLYGGLLHHQNIKCPAGKRAYAWVHPHFTFTANCQLNRATFPRFLAPENVLIRPSRILFLSLAPSKRGHRLPPIASFSSTR